MTKDHLPPLKAIREYCLWCSNSQKEEIRLCPSLNLQVPFDMDKKKYSALQAIREKCIDCKGYELKAVRLCEFKKDCPLYPFRMGRNPKRTGITSNGLLTGGHIKTPETKKKPTETRKLEH